jgi:two-component system, LytTR family, sensor histidine kinase AlgZ
VLGSPQATREVQPAVAELGTRAPDDGGVLEPLLPPELIWLYAVVPLPAAYLLRQGALEFQASDLAFVLLKAYLPFGIFGGAFELVYRHVMPRLLRRMRASLRWVAHLGVTIAVVLAASALLLPLIGQLAGHRPPAGNFILISLIFSALCLFPSLALQRQRLRARRAEERALREREAALEAQLQALQARTNPHFLFNSLNTIASLIHDNPRLAERSLERLAELFRYTLAASSARTVKLELELAMVSDYLELQTARFGERLKSSLAVTSGVGDVEVPPLLLQPLVENAILHGMAQQRGGKVEVVVRGEPTQLVIEVRDDGPGLGRSTHVGAGTSVHTIRERLRLHYGTRATLSFAHNGSDGCVARLALPWPDRS